MIAYFDTSAAVKLVVEEVGSPEAVRIWDGATQVVSSVLLYPEARAALRRARRNRRLTDAALRRAVRDVERLWQRMESVTVSVDLAFRAGALAHTYDLRGSDAVHLAAAELVGAPDLVFVAADHDLCTAAARFGLAVARVGR